MVTNWLTEISRATALSVPPTISIRASSEGPQLEFRTEWNRLRLTIVLELGDEEDAGVDAAVEEGVVAVTAVQDRTDLSQLMLNSKGC